MFVIYTVLVHTVCWVISTCVERYDPLVTLPKAHILQLAMYKECERAIQCKHSICLKNCCGIFPQVLPQQIMVQLLRESESYGTTLLLSVGENAIVPCRQQTCVAII